MKELLIVSYFLILISFGSCNPCSPAESLDISESIVQSNGSVFYNNIEYKSGAWYEEVQDGQNKRFGCPCIGRICIWKCCGQQQVFLNYSCVNATLPEVDPFNPTVYKGRDPTDLLASNIFFYFYRHPRGDCYVVDTATSEELYLQENGTLIEVAPGGIQWHNNDQYCLEMNTANLAQAPNLVAGVCYPVVVSDDSPLLYTAYAIGLLLSVPFLLATFLVYALVPDLRNLHGMCLMAYCSGLIVAYSCLAYLKLHTGQIGVEMSGCVTVAFIVYYAFETSFFWLNVMCFDIWRTFSGYRGGSTSKRRERKRFAMYGLYAWGVPLVLTAVTIAMQFSDVPENIITPGFGTRRCWFVNWTSELVYFFSPVLALVVCNVVFFSVTAHRIRSIRQETDIMLKGAESSRSDKLKKDKQRYALYLKLFMVMGVNWTLELLGFVIGGSNVYYIVLDISNMALGVFIFFIFVWKKKVRILVQKRFRTMFRESTSTDGRSRWTTSTAPTEDTRLSTGEPALRLKDMH